MLPEGRVGLDIGRGNGVSNLALPGSSAAQRAAASLAAVGLLAIGIVPALFGTHDLPILHGLFSVAAAWWIFADLATAFLLLASFYASGIAAYAAVAAVYTICALLAFPCVFLLTGTFASGSAAGLEQVQPFFWAARAVVFGALVAIAIFIDPSARLRVTAQDRAARTIAYVLVGSLVAAVALGALVFGAEHALPVLVREGQFSPAFNRVVAPAVACALTLFTILIVGGLRRASALQLWLAVALGANAIGAALMGAAPAQYSAAWYAANLEAFATAGLLLGVVAYDVTGAFRRLAQFARFDSLTGLCNRRAFDEHLAWAIDEAEEHGASVGLLVIDIDLFKGFNDRYGHAAGDDAMREVAGALLSTFPSELVARVGGEEFVAMLSDLDAQGAYRAGERARLAVERLAIPFDGSPARRLTISVGAAGGKARNLDRIGLFKAADAALYSAKALGRNKTVLAKNVPSRRIAFLRNSARA